VVLSEQVEKDASKLIAWFGEGALDEARRLAREERFGQMQTGNRPPGHWEAVCHAIARRTNRVVDVQR
jgi:hypothetical protein